MIIAEVVGTVVATQKTDNIQQLALRVVRQITTAVEQTSKYQVAVDVVGADDGEYVLVTSGSAARQTHLTDNRPCDAVIMAIVDTWQTGGDVRYTKT